MSQIGPDDIQAAQAFWQARAPKKFKRLLDAQPVEELDIARTTRQPVNA
jgi:hypothetical protein